MKRPRGATVWLTGLPGAGKTTLSMELEEALLTSGRLAYRLDGDELRRTLCADLGFDRASRAENVRRAANVGMLMADAGLIVLAALISPYATDRAAARQLHERRGLTFVEVYLDTPVEICRRRDPKGLYGQANQGELIGLTGIDSPYEPPARPDVRLSEGPVLEHVEQVLAVLERIEADGGGET